MDNVKVAKELVKVARLVQGAQSHGFTILKPLKLESEGSTRSSLNNAKAIADAGYELESTRCSFNRDRADYKVEAQFSRGSEKIQVWTFKGLSAGYGGEGPHGLIEFGKIFGINLDPDKVFKIDYLRDNGLLDGKPFRIIVLL